MSFFFPWRRRVAEIRRVRHITEVLIRNGLGFMVEMLALERLLPRFWRRPPVRAEEAASRRSVPERLRRTLEELGATYVKVGQFLSGRADLLPPAYIEELIKLLDSAPPVPFEDVRKLVERELGAAIPDLFLNFEELPIASASIGQVHRAILFDGRAVVVKVQRPDIEEQVDADLDLLLRQARFLERRSETMRDQNLVAIVEELARSVREELNYQLEGRNAERLRSNFRDQADYLFPEVYWSLTSRRVITLEYLEGVQFNEVDRLCQAGYDLPSVAQAAVEGYLQQIFVDGFYQADPHPANLLVVGQRIGFLDFGNVGHLTHSQKQLLGDLFLQILDEDTEGVARTVVRMGASRGRPSLDDMERDLQRLLVRYWGLALENLPVGEMLAEIFKTARQYKVYLPGDLALLARTIITMEGTARLLDPAFVLVDVVRPFAVQLVRRQFLPIVAGRRALRAARQATDLIGSFPRRVDDLWDQLEAGELTFGVDLRRLELILHRVNSMINRIAFSVLVAALIIGSSLILLGGKESWQLPFLGFELPVAQIVFLGAILAGGWFLLWLIRSRNL